MNAKQIKTIKAELKKLKPKRLSFDSERSFSNKEAIIILAVELEAMKRKGFTTAELVKILKERGISTNGATLNRYLNEARKNKTGIQPMDNNISNCVT